MTGGEVACSSCRWWEPGEEYGETGRGTGDCTRFPPVPVWAPGLGACAPESVWPETGCMASCGEWEAAG